MVWTSSYPESNICFDGSLNDLKSRIYSKYWHMPKLAAHRGYSERKGPDFEMLQQFLPNLGTTNETSQSTTTIKSDWLRHPNIRFSTSREWWASLSWGCIYASILYGKNSMHRDLANEVPFQKKAKVCLPTTHFLKSLWVFTVSFFGHVLRAIPHTKCFFLTKKESKTFNLWGFEIKILHHHFFCILLIM